MHEQNEKPNKMKGRKKEKLLSTQYQFYTLAFYILLYELNKTYSSFYY
jgi:hypothetical protein